MQSKAKNSWVSLLLLAIGLLFAGLVITRTIQATRQLSDTYLWLSHANPSQDLRATVYYNDDLYAVLGFFGHLYNAAYCPDCSFPIRVFGQKCLKAYSSGNMFLSDRLHPADGYTAIYLRISGYSILFPQRRSSVRASGKHSGNDRRQLCSRSSP